jgi:hypothetical protein
MCILLFLVPCILTVCYHAVLIVLLVIINQHINTSATSSYRQTTDRPINQSEIYHDFFEAFNLKTDLLKFKQLTFFINLIWGFV